MSVATSPDEQPKKKIAKRVITGKRKYFVPDHGVVVEAEDAIKAVSQAKRSRKTETNQVEEGDA